ncbi:MAG: hypothetical protein L0Y55_08680, partial [Anaerolineales bacterium]|nr:hypothetical protein [Anaerolineales bacterium]
EELIERFNTRAQAQFYIEHLGASFAEYDAAHDAYYRARDAVQDALPQGVRAQFVERSFLPTFLFGPNDLVVTLGPDGLVVNTSKYLTTQPILALNPDPQRVDGILVPFLSRDASVLFANVLQNKFTRKRISMAQAALNNGQTLYAVNDLFIGVRTHTSARYELHFGGVREHQSSSGIIVSTGAGSTGWYRSIVTGAAGVMEHFADVPEVKAAREEYRFDWEANYLYFAVREPFVSKTSSAQMIFGRIEKNQTLDLVSEMPQNGAIFSDGIEADYLEFNSGALARIGLAEKKVNLIVGAGNVVASKPSPTFKD